MEHLFCFVVYVIFLCANMDGLRDYIRNSSWGCLFKFNFHIFFGLIQVFIKHFSKENCLFSPSFPKKKFINKNIFLKFLIYMFCWYLLIININAHHCK